MGRPPKTSLRWLRGAPAPPREVSYRLFCLPYAGGGASVFRSWPALLPDVIEPVAVQLPGRESRLGERSLSTIAEMVDVLLPEVRVATDRPYAIFGHSLGAVLAFELAAALERDEERPPYHLFASGRRPPDEHGQEVLIHAWPEVAFLDALQERYGGVPQELRNEPELLALLLPVLRAEIAANETYAMLSNPKLHCGVSVYGGVFDKHPDPAALPGWSRVTERPVRVKLFAGDHFFVNSERDALVADISEVMLGSLIAASR